ncbi:PH domain-containing protein [Rhodococcus sp. HNM0569]|uniref:PH domain-containing protein n=1 Tax=Rhodococcus sp. HNM0569 TaxID=2716340 RepID=UPI00146E78B7|nr:PH domain-containing protein [Rhodococcus sp. HNM0569]
MTPSEPLVAWATPRAATGALFVLGVVLLGASVAVPLDGPGRVLVAIAGVGVLVTAALSARQRPRLAVAPGPRLVLQRLTRRLEFSREQIDRIRVVRYARIGRRVPMLELDLRDGDHERLVVFGRWDLGAAPDEVFDALKVQGLVPPSRSGPAAE